MQCPKLIITRPLNTPRQTSFRPLCSSQSRQLRLDESCRTNKIPELTTTGNACSAGCILRTSSSVPATGPSITNSSALKLGLAMLLRKRTDALIDARAWNPSPGYTTYLFQRPRDRSIYHKFIGAQIGDSPCYCGNGQTRSSTRAPGTRRPAARALTCPCC